MISRNTDPVGRIVDLLTPAVTRAGVWSKEGQAALKWLSDNRNSSFLSHFSGSSMPIEALPKDSNYEPGAGSILEAAVRLLEAIDAGSDYLGAGEAIARAQDGVVQTDWALRLIKRATWCKAKNDDSLRRNFRHRLNESKLFRETDDGTFLLIEVHGGAPAGELVANSDDPELLAEEVSEGVGEADESAVGNCVAAVSISVSGDPVPLLPC